MVDPVLRAGVNLVIGHRGQGPVFAAHRQRHGDVGLGDGAAGIPGPSGGQGHGGAADVGDGRRQGDVLGPNAAIEVTAADEAHLVGTVAPAVCTFDDVIPILALLQGDAVIGQDELVRQESGVVVGVVDGDRAIIQIGGLDGEDSAGGAGAVPFARHGNGILTRVDPAITVAHLVIRPIHQGLHPAADQIHLHGLAGLIDGAAGIDRRLGRKDHFGAVKVDVGKAARNAAIPREIIDAGDG